MGVSGSLPDLPDSTQATAAGSSELLSGSIDRRTGPAAPGPAGAASGRGGSRAADLRLAGLLSLLAAAGALLSLLKALLSPLKSPVGWRLSKTLGQCRSESEFST